MFSWRTKTRRQQKRISSGIRRVFFYFFFVVDESLTMTAAHLILFNKAELKSRRCTRPINKETSGRDEGPPQRSPFETAFTSWNTTEWERTGEDTDEESFQHAHEYLLRTLTKLRQFRNSLNKLVICICEWLCTVYIEAFIQRPQPRPHGQLHHTLWNIWVYCT